jgi:hypothetical protein
MLISVYREWIENLEQGIATNREYCFDKPLKSYCLGMTITPHLAEFRMPS